MMCAPFTGQVPSLPHRVLPYQGKQVQIVLVGAGGTGSWLAIHLARLVWDFNRTWEVVHDTPARKARLLIFDDDTVEEGNIRARQNFCPAEIGYPKAQLLAYRFGSVFGMDESEVAARVERFTAQHLTRQWEELTLLVGASDNALARQEMAKCLTKAAQKKKGDDAPGRIWWIDAGNALHSGQVLCGNTATVEQLRGACSEPMCLRLPSPALVHPELLQPLPDEIEENATRLSCTDLVLAAEPEVRQSRTINNHMAAIVYGYIEQLLYGGLTTFATYTDNSSFTTRSLETTPQDFAQALGQTPDFFTTTTTKARRSPSKKSPRTA